MRGCCLILRKSSYCATKQEAQESWPVPRKFLALAPLYLLDRFSSWICRWISSCKVTMSKGKPKPVKFWQICMILNPTFHLIELFRISLIFTTYFRSEMMHDFAEKSKFFLGFRSFSGSLFDMELEYDIA